ncbi:acyl carrier protein [Paenibacillus sp. N3/727]|uniref:acyl carrier protein n=1 Tax=Paenibacillus sp. N3/727 TaxID=2925845 RepID=UPI001F53C431|nr:acyl carrier protein [Paenibacillus sp. N3/727]UNK18926.1 acyl carrier protein [Paenibacillus sp. N3/727]
MKSKSHGHVEEAVISIIAQCCNKEVSEIQLDHSLANDLGVDSIQFLELLFALEEGFGFQMEVDDLHPEKFRSVQSVIRFVAGKIAA